jgi:glycosyltransferase involved in cell wall biosynthesis
MARASHIPYIIAAHGMADPWALRHKQWKKVLYLTLVERRNLRAAACLHALSQQEVEHLRSLAPHTPVALIPNGVDLSTYRRLPSRAEMEDAHPELEGKFVLLFFGRLHVKKGLDLLAVAFHRILRLFPDAHLLLAGIDDGAWKSFRDEINQLGHAGSITYLGHVEGHQALQAWATADAFILPSYSEGFSMAILEALACSLPCVITNKCHFPELARIQGAIVVDSTQDGITDGLRTLLRMTAQERQQMAHKGHGLVKAHYTWDRQVLHLASVYCWLTGQENRPECVFA